ncbi:uncharacterized protein RAG0_05722 [Rhynchosporium agropyri]|uniref:Uncharacterized protein n=1 Tax=Rhynchosporium agropyri TaxID=914238 RepID=A0A1E1KE83_9HELO|nr:uncharacterized protein RAG0_05722 [Rhynchosporium agropyri]
MTDRCQRWLAKLEQSSDSMIGNNSAERQRIDDHWPRISGSVQKVFEHLLPRSRADLKFLPIQCELLQNIGEEDGDYLESHMEANCMLRKHHLLELWCDVSLVLHATAEYLDGGVQESPGQVAEKAK